MWPRILHNLKIKSWGVSVCRLIILNRVFPVLVAFVNVLENLERFHRKAEWNNKIFKLFKQSNRVLHGTQTKDAFLFVCGLYKWKLWDKQISACCQGLEAWYTLFVILSIKAALSRALLTFGLALKNTPHQHQDATNVNQKSAKPKHLQYILTKCLRAVLLRSQRYVIFVT